MKTVGSILREARLARGWTLEKVEQATKIRVKFLQAIEDDDYSVLPSLSYAKGFVKNYSDFLGLDSKTTLAFFRRQTTEVSRSSLLPKKSEAPYAQSLFQLTPAKFIALIVALLVLAFLGYFGFQFRRIQLPPSLTIDAPKNQAVVTERKTDVLGSTDPDATVMVNGITVLVRSDGKFFDQVALEPGVNKITITATSRFGKVTTVVREVGLQLP
jgi:cytoskeletal protein RodZ